MRQPWFVGAPSRAALGLGALSALMGCATFRAPRVDPGPGARSDTPRPLALRFLEEEFIPGTGLYRVAGDGRASVRDLVELVSQKGGGDDELDSTYCATLAVIKAGMYLFGVDGLVTRMPAGPVDPEAPDDPPIEVRLRNGTSIRVARWKLDLVARSVHLGVLDYTALGATPRRLERWVHFYLAVAAVNLASLATTQRLRHVTCTSTPVDDEQTFREALVAVVNGYTTERAPRLLGLAIADDLPQGQAPVAAIGWTRRHAMFVARVGEGEETETLVDRWGEVRAHHGGGMTFRWLLDASNGPPLDDSDGRQWDPFGNTQFVCARRAGGDQQGDLDEPAVTAPLRHDPTVSPAVSFDLGAGGGFVRFDRRDHDSGTPSVAVFDLGAGVSVRLRPRVALGLAYHFQSQAAPVAQAELLTDERAAMPSILRDRYAQFFTRSIVDLHVAFPIALGATRSLLVTPRLGPSLVYSYSVSRDPAPPLTEGVGRALYDQWALGVIVGTSCEYRYKAARMGLDLSWRMAWQVAGSAASLDSYNFSALARFGLDLDP